MGLFWVQCEYIKIIKIVLTFFFRKLRVKEKPHHITTNEENKAMLDRLLRVKGPWAMVLTATILRLDFAQKREKNVEKTINQIEVIIINKLSN